MDPALLAVVKDINKALEKTKSGSVYFGSDHPPIARLRTGILALDVVTGGGLPRGQLTELFGEESSGKTTAALLTTAKVLNDGGSACWVAREGFDKKWAIRCGVDLDRLVLLQTHYGDTSLEAALTMVEKGVLDLLVMDSVQSFGTEREEEGGIEAESFGGGGAGQLWGRVMRRGYSATAREGRRTAMVAISQVRSPIGKMGFKGQKPDPEPTGIWAIKHWKSVSIQFKKGEPLYANANDLDRKVIIAREFKIKCKKNKTAAPDRASSYTIYFKDHGTIPKGVDRIGQAIRLGRVHGLVSNSGAWFEGYGIRAQGLDKYVEAFRAKPKKLLELEQDVLDAEEASA